MKTWKILTASFLPAHRDGLLTLTCRPAARCRTLLLLFPVAFPFLKLCQLISLVTLLQFSAFIISAKQVFSTRQLSKSLTGRHGCSSPRKIWFPDNWIAQALTDNKIISAKQFILIGWSGKMFHPAIAGGRQKRLIFQILFRIFRMQKSAGSLLI